MDEVSNSYLNMVKPLTAPVGIDQSAPLVKRESFDT